MGEVSFTVKNSNVLKVRLEPTDVQGRDVAGQPVLRLPLKLQLLPAGPQQGTAAEYVLLRLAGSVFSNPIGEFAKFEAGPLAEVSNASVYERQHEVVVPLDRVRVRRFEDARGGANANLRISFSALVWFPAPQSTFAAIQASSELQVLVPKSHWVDQVVQPWGLESVKFIEITFPKSEAGEKFRAAYLHVDAAEKLFANGQYKQVLAELYSCFEGLAKSMNLGKPDQQFFAQLLAELHPTKKESAKRTLDNLCDFLHLGRHEAEEAPEAFGISRGDARFALIMSQAVLEYITPRG